MYVSWGCFPYRYILNSIKKERFLNLPFLLNLMRGALFCNCSSVTSLLDTTRNVAPPTEGVHLRIIHLKREYLRIKYYSVEVYGVIYLIGS